MLSCRGLAIVVGPNNSAQPRCILERHNESQDLNVFLRHSVIWLDISLALVSTCLDISFQCFGGGHSINRIFFQWQIISDKRLYVLETWVKRGAELSTDHYLVVCWIHCGWGGLPDKLGKSKRGTRVYW